MSGHSKWNNIAKRKGANDAKKAKIFTKIGREMAIAIKEGGSANPDFNARLRDCIAKAKANNMPNDTIERGIKKAAGNAAAINYETVRYEGYGPNGIAIIVDALTDNRNRTAANVRNCFTKGGGNVGAQGCVSYMFDHKGQIIIAKEDCDIDADDLMMMALDAGAEDFSDEDDSYEIITAPEDFSQVRESLEKEGIKMAEAELTMIPQNYVDIDDPEVVKKFTRIIDMLEEDDDVQAVYHNANLPEEDDED